MLLVALTKPVPACLLQTCILPAGVATQRAILFVQNLGEYSNDVLYVRAGPLM